MKVIHLFRTGGEGYGLERNILCTLPGLVEQGADVVALAVRETRSGPIAAEFAGRLDTAGVRLREVECEGRLPFRLARRLSDVFAREMPDVIHSHDYKCDLAMLLARTGDAVRMTTVHGWCSRNARERFYEWLNVQCCKRMDAVVVFCEDYRRRLVRRGVPERLVRVVPVGLDVGVVPREGIDFRERWGVPEDGLLVVQVGRLSREKRPETFVRIAAGLADEFPDVRFVLVGDGDLRSEVERQIADSNRSGAIRLAGYVSAIADVLDAADVAVNCSSTESIPRTLLEAGIAGVPVVATAVGGVPDAIEDGVTGVLCPPGDEAAIRDALGRLLRDGDLRQRMGAAARERVRTVFSVETCSRRLDELYREMLAGRRGGRP